MFVFSVVLLVYWYGMCVVCDWLLFIDGFNWCYCCCCSYWCVGRLGFVGFVLVKWSGSYGVVWLLLGFWMLLCLVYWCVLIIFVLVGGWVIVVIVFCSSLVCLVCRGCSCGVVVLVVFCVWLVVGCWFVLCCRWMFRFICCCLLL